MKAIFLTFAVYMAVVPMAFTQEANGNEKIRILDVERLPNPESLSEWVKAIQWDGFELIESVEVQGFWIAFFRSQHNSLAIAIEDTKKYKENGPTLAYSVSRGDGKDAVIKIDESGKGLPRYYFTKFTLNGEQVSGKRLDFIDEYLKTPLADKIRVRISANSEESYQLLFDDDVNFKGDS